MTTLPPPVPALAELYRTREPGADPAHLVRLSRNERLSALPDWFMEELRRALHNDLLTRYPGDQHLYQQLSATLELPVEQLLLTAGSDAAVKALYHAYVRPGDAVVMLDPSYAMYPVYAQMFQAEAVLIPFDHDLTLNVSHLQSSIAQGVRLVMLANPNQPTATLLNEDALLRLIERAADVGALLAIDEAYYPFSRTTVLPWIEEHPHLLVIRTFSKAAGLAGLRIGFVAGHADVIGNLYKVRSVHDVNSFAILCASQILAHPQVVNDYVAEVGAGGALLAERARALGLTPLPTHTNFMLIRVAHRCPPPQLVESLRERGYLVKGPFNTPCLADCIRVTLGPPELMASFAECLREVLASL